MSFLDVLRGGAIAEMPDEQLLSEADTLREQLRGEQETTLHLQEALAELEAEDAGWARIDGLATQRDFTRRGVGAIAASSRLNYLANPLIRRAVNVRTYYTWGQGVEVSVRDDQVNEVVQAFLDDPLNQQVLFSQDARLEKDHDLQLEGNLLLALFTSPLTGQVQVRSMPFDEIVDVISDPEDRERRWFYRREWNATVIDPATGASRQQQMRALYPDIGYRPLRRPKRVGEYDVEWDSPVLHVRVGGLGGMKFGVPEVYAALPWARAYRGFLEDWASLAKALSKFAWKGKTKAPRVAAMRRAIEGQQSPDGVLPRGPGQAGGGFVADPETDLTPISKTGATLDATSGRPLAMMVSAALDVPYTILMGDADIGNRATARTLDRPTELAMEARREMWAGIYRALCNYAVDQAVKAPRGPLRGTVRRPAETPDLEVITLGGDVDRNIDIDWPSLLEHDQKAVVDAIVAADGTHRLPAELVCRLLLLALDVENVDEVLDDLTDADGKFLDPKLGAMVAAAAPQAVAAAPVAPAAPPGTPGAAEALREAIGPLPEHERFTDFGQIQSEWQAALDVALAGYLVQRDEQAARLAQQVAAGATTPAQLELAAGDTAPVILAALLQLHDLAGQRAAGEALLQGQAVTPPEADLARLGAQAAVVGDLLDRSMTSSAAREALRLDGLPSDEVAAGVTRHLRLLTDAQPRELIGGALTAAQNIAREAVFTLVVGGAFYAAERLDRNTCSKCAHVDGTRFDTLAAAAKDYPSGGYVDCLGRERCRGLFVWSAAALAA